MILPPSDPNFDHRLTDKPPLRDDTRFAAGKIAIFQYTTVGVFLFLISGFWRLQVQNPQFYLGRAEEALGDSAAAAEAYRRAVSSDSYFHEGRDPLTRAYIRL